MHVRPRARRRRLPAATLGVSLVAAVVLPIGAAQAAPEDELPPQEPGVTLRAFDVGLELEQICQLTEGQTPNIDVLRPTVDWESDEDFGGIGNNFVAHVIGNIHVPDDGTYDFRLISDDGSRLYLDDQEIIVNDQRQPPTAVDGTAELTAGAHALRIEYFQGAYDKALRLEWSPPGQEEFELVPESALTTDEGVTRVTSPGVKSCSDVDASPGDGAPLAGVHPDYEVTDLRPEGYEPRITGMDWFDDGRMVITTWAGRESFDGAVEIVDGTVGEDADPADVTTEVVATDMNEPQGVLVEDGEVVVAEKHQLSRLIDADGDGVYEDKEALATWPSGGTYHEFGFGLLADEEYYYLNLSVAITPGGRTTVPQHVENRGTSVRIVKETGELEYVAGGLRTPNGIGWGPEGEVFVTDNQGDWLPSSKLVEIEEGAFYNHYTTPPGPFDDQPVTEPVLWLPHGEISNSPTNPVVVEEGPFAGQLVFGDVTYGGIQRAYLEEVDGRKQGAVFRMTQGLESGVSRLAIGPDGSFYVGGIGGGGNWEQPGKFPYGLQKLTRTSDDAMDILSMEVTESGFDLTYTKPVAADVVENAAERYEVEQWSYTPTQQYGGEKRNEEVLAVTGASVSDDGRTVSLEIPGLREDRVAHVRSPRPFEAADGTELWSTEAWYTVHTIPNYEEPPNEIGVYEAENGTLAGLADIDDEHAHHTGGGYVDGFDNIGAQLTWDVRVDEAGTYPVTFRYANGPNPYVGTKTISLDVNGEDKGQIAVETTEVWNAWADHVEQLELREGNNTITVSAGEDDDRHVNWDHLRIQQEPCAPAQPDEGYRMLFDGTEGSLADWDMAAPGDFIHQADCTIRSVGGLGLLTHPEEFTDYRLKLDWKMGGDDNSGVHIGVPDPQGDPEARNQGFEVQIDATDEPEKTTGAIYNFQGADIAARDEALNPPGEWNSYEIVVEDLRVQVYLNGVLINDFDTEGADPERDLSSGRVGLQNHHTGSDVWFRDVQVMPLA
ncbi:Carbohydrate binding module (family 35) [Streptomyces zhaozhouensis]|uniref:Carbohydrate binding module (Family 35) n=1 Tax=Streptomyces zhaozhouensis TaxID=1300267 RepID=A0A286DLQ1_9ACTN|nr:family 16 glycoside hydrolase [Streptomyces zhaozhouensis]SOD59560.1 Carbohydrate binding module (family 35) [Streptomyces zhaozhouensis]